MLSYLKKDGICKIPDLNTFVYKDECAYCFHTPEHENGLYICMNTFIAVCRSHLKLFFEKSKHSLFLNLKIERRFKSSNEEINVEETEYQKMLKEACFSNKFETTEYHSLFLMPSGEEIILPDTNIPENVSMSIRNILDADSLAKTIERASKADKWDGTYLSESKYAYKLKQLDNGVKVPPSGWKCAKCDFKTNLWMNLTDGTILCGRKFHDGSGGNNHAIEYYRDTDYPLAVKLGTITPGHADVFSYAEDDMVIDPILPAHLAHFGIDVMKMRKTDKTVEELEVENIKRNREQIAIMESESNLELMIGPGFTGMVNTGNSCYINSVMQVLFSIPQFVKFYSNRYHSIVQRYSVINDVRDFGVQMAKLGFCLLSGDYSFGPIEIPKKDGELIKPLAGIIPQTFRYVVGKGHPEFSTKEQQDANEFLLHILNLVEQDVKGQVQDNQSLENPLSTVAFKMEDRVFCESTQTVKYNERSEFVLSLPIPLTDVVNKDEMNASKENNMENEETVKPKIPLEACIKAFMNADVIEDYKTVTGQRGCATQTSRMKTFPDYLWVQLKRFTIGNDWMPVKMDVEVLVPDTIDLTSMRAKGGLQPGEIEMADEKPSIQHQLPQMDLNMHFVSELQSMGFSENACRKAVYFTSNRSLEDATNWLLVHVGESGFDDELSVELMQIHRMGEDAPMPAEEDISMLVNMGFGRHQAVKALRETGGNLELAADWAFNHLDELADLPDEEVPPISTATVAKEDHAAVPTSDGPGRYSLCAMISHMGNNTHVGHYVCHIRHQQPDGSDQWVMFNDEKVQRSVSPPKQFAYLYLFKRII